MNDERVTMTTYKRVDGGEIGDYGWVTDVDQCEYDAEDADGPTEYVEEVWQRVSARTFSLPICHECDEPATHWGLCEAHARADDPDAFAEKPAS